MTDKSIRDDLGELTEAVRELRDREVAGALRELRAEVEQLRAERDAHQCQPCTHLHWHQTWPVPGCASGYPQMWYTNVSASPVNINPGVLTAGVAPATVLSISS